MHAPVRVLNNCTEFEHNWIQTYPVKKNKKKTYFTLLVDVIEEEVGRQHQGMDRPGVCHVPEGSGEKKNEGN